MKSPSNLSSIRNRTLEGIGAILFEIFDAPILLLYSTNASERKLIFQSGIEPKGIPDPCAWNAYLHPSRPHLVLLEDLRLIEKSDNRFADLLSQGIQCCCKLDLVNDHNQKFGELYLMDYSSHSMTFPNLKLLEATRELATQILHRDIIDREILREKEETRSTNRIVLEATELSGSGGLCLNLQTKSLFWYKSNNSVLGLPTDFRLSYTDLTGETQSFDPVIYPQLLAFTEQVRQGIKSLRNSSGEGTITIPLGKKRHFHYSVHKTKDTLYLVFKDNTNLVEMGLELARIQSLLKAEESQQLTAAWTLKLKNQEMSWSDNVKVLLELSTDTSPRWDIFVQKLNLCDSCGPNQIVEVCLGPKGKFEQEVDILLESGKKRHLHIQCMLSHSQTGDLLLLGNLRDNTEAKQTEAEVEKLLSHIWRSDNYLDGLLLNETFYLIRVGMDGTYKFINQHYKNCYYKPGKSHSDDHDPMEDILEEDRILCHEGVEKALNNPESNVKVFLRKLTWDKKILYTQWDFKVLMDENNNPMEILCIGIDVTEIQTQKEKLKELINLVSKQNTQLIEYNSILSHNIRNHVANLKGLSNLIELTHDPKDVLNYFGLIKEAINSLDQRITAINYLNRQKNQSEADKEKIRLSEIIANAKAFFEEELSLIGADFYIITDPELLKKSVSSILERILVQLISNSIKFRSPKRGLIIQIKVRESLGKLTIAVQDNGIGMDLKKSKVNTFDSMEVKNLEPNSKGLGIFLAKHLTETLEGSIKYISRVDCGTKVILTFDHVR